ncbi:hypothetical protein CDD83_7316 [Cordyceps sp. RAO-2017]|nr:hypothetical protein CDD83_7316 [Cordyceps sp. RAO-2017]
MYEPRSTDRTSILLDEAGSFCIIAVTPFFFFLFYWIAYNDFRAELSTAAGALFSEKSSFFADRMPYPTAVSVVGYAIWVLVQAALYHGLPGHLHQAPRTPGGRRLLYRLNGMRAWIITVGIAAAASYLELIDAAFIARNWGALLATANLYSLALVVIFYIKARVKPDNVGETLFTGKYRDLSFMALQYQLYGEVTNSMLIAIVFRAIIVGEYFLYEEWFFETLDGAHERFSFYNIYGFAATMPQIWTLQTHYLVLHPVKLSNSEALAVVAAFAVGWSLNHYANEQKSRSRQTGGKMTIWGREAQVLEATFGTADGKKHRTVLLCSGMDPSCHNLHKRVSKP